MCDRYFGLVWQAQEVELYGLPARPLLSFSNLHVFHILSRRRWQ
jgi:hypothetical protein